MAAWLFCRNAQTPGRARGDDAGNVGTDTIYLVALRGVRSLVDREEQCGVPRAAPSSTLTWSNGGRSATYAICDRFSSCLASEMRSPFSSRLGCASNALATGSSSILLLLYSLKVSIAGSVGRLGVVSRTNGARVSFFPRGRPRRGAQHVRRCPAPAEKSSMRGSGCRVAKESDVVFAPQRKGHFFCQALGDSEAWDDNLAVVLLDSHIIAESPGETIAVLPSSRPRPRPADRCKTSTSASRRSLQNIHVQMHILSFSRMCSSGSGEEPECTYATVVLWWHNSYRSTSGGSFQRRTYRVNVLMNTNGNDER
ncbi:hypothetical protein V8E55_003568 [Tylopilus felleus]